MGTKTGQGMNVLSLFDGMHLLAGHSLLVPVGMQRRPDLQDARQWLDCGGYKTYPAIPVKIKYK